jgi:hypothetical protein
MRARPQLARVSPRVENPEAFTAKIEQRRDIHAVSKWQRIRLARDGVPVLETAVTHVSWMHIDGPRELRGDPLRIRTAFLDLHERVWTTPVGLKAEHFVDTEIRRLAADAPAHRGLAPCMHQHRLAQPDASMRASSTTA